MRWAIIDDNRRVTSTVEQDERPDGGVKAPDGSDCAVGRIWNGWTFDAPRWTAYQFLLRFTAQERALIRTTALSDQQVDDFLFLATAAHEVAADDPMTIAGMDYLVSISIITEQRKQEILS